MKKEVKILKIGIDIFMGIAMVLLLSTKITGMTWHEILGIAIGVGFVTHIILNYKWVINMTKNLFNRQVEVKAKIMYILDIVLAIFMIADIVLGILISEVLFPNINVGNRAIIIAWHKFCAYWMLIVMSVHIGFHWDRVVNVFNNIIKEAKDNLFVKIILKVIYAVVGVLGIIGLMKQSVNSNLLIPNTNTQNNFNKTTNGANSTSIDSGSSILNTPNNQSTTNVADSNSTTDNSSTEANNLNTDSSSQSDNSTSKKNNSSTASSSSTSSTLSTASSVDEYLGNLHCTGCGRHCVLTNPQCNVGATQAQQATQEYNSSTSTSSSQDSGSTTTQNSETISSSNQTTTTQNSGVQSSRKNSSKTTTGTTSLSTSGSDFEITDISNSEKTTEITTLAKNKGGSTGQTAQQSNQSTDMTNGNEQFTRGQRPDKGNFNPNDQTGTTNSDNFKSNQMPNDLQNGDFNPNITNQQDKKSKDEATITDYVTIMGFFIGGTYYVLKVIKKIKNKNEK